LVGIGIPFETGEAVSVISGWVLKAEYWLYINSTDLKPVYFPGIFNDNGIGPLNSFGRKRREILTDNVTGQLYERLDGEVKVVENQADPVDIFDDGGDDYNYDEDENLMPPKINDAGNIKYDHQNRIENSRWTFYKSLETVLLR
jgi:hypothetical protein